MVLKEVIVCSSSLVSPPVKTLTFWAASAINDLRAERDRLDMDGRVERRMHSV